MELILWRHAQAEDPRPGQSDLDRALTTKGQKQAKTIAMWLNQHLPHNTQILCSPSVRTRQTADALHRPYQVSDLIAPNAHPQDLIAVTDRSPSQYPILLIGHQPALGQLAALLLTGKSADWSIKKSAVWWLVRPGKQSEQATTLRLILSPDFLKA